MLFTDKRYADMSAEEKLELYWEIENEIAAINQRQQKCNMLQKIIKEDLGTLLLSEDNNSARLDNGTVFFTTMNYVNVVDKTEFINWCMSTGNTHLYRREVATAEVKRHIKVTQIPPEGIGYSTAKEVIIRKPTNRITEIDA